MAAFLLAETLSKRSMSESDIEMALAQAVQNKSMLPAATHIMRRQGETELFISLSHMVVLIKI